MNKKNPTTFLISILAVLTCFGQAKKEEVKSDISILKSNDLYTAILRQDSALFRAFNTCDSGEYRMYFADNLEFYHDIGGLTVSLESEMTSLKEMCARGTKVRRELIQTDLEVYPIGNYGAVEVGSHRFYFTNKGEAEKLGGIYKFVHIWQLKDGAWKISRVVSYGHNKKS
jgi:hypothetical protein